MSGASDVIREMENSAKVEAYERNISRTIIINFANPIRYDKDLPLPNIVKAAVFNRLRIAPPKFDRTVFYIAKEKRTINNNTFIDGIETFHTKPHIYKWDDFMEPTKGWQEVGQFKWSPMIEGREAKTIEYRDAQWKDNLIEYTDRVEITDFYQQLNNHNNDRIYVNLDSPIEFENLKKILVGLSYQNFKFKGKTVIVGVNRENIISVELYANYHGYSETRKELWEFYGRCIKTEEGYMIYDRDDNFVELVLEKNAIYCSIDPPYTKTLGVHYLAINFANPVNGCLPHPAIVRMELERMKHPLYSIDMPLLIAKQNANEHSTGKVYSCEVFVNDSSHLQEWKLYGRRDITEYLYKGAPKYTVLTSDGDDLICFHRDDANVELNMEHIVDHLKMASNPARTIYGWGHTADVVEKDNIVERISLQASLHALEERFNKRIDAVVAAMDDNNCELAEEIKFLKKRVRQLEGN